MHSETYTAFMLDRCTGALEPGLRVAADLHAALNPQGREAVGFWEAVGGALLEDAAEQVDAPRRRGHSSRDDEALAVADILSRDLTNLNWRRSLGGVQTCKSGIARAHFMKLEPEDTVPRHGHSAIEATVVLEGELEDDGIVYRRGDIALGVPGRSHRPAAHGNSACICFVARGKRPFWRLT